MFSNMDRIINEVNSNIAQYGVKLRYATPVEYFDQLNRLNVAFPTKNKDFFPYHAGPVNWWTGYYTSRPAFKKMLRDADHIQRVAEVREPPREHFHCETITWPLTSVYLHRHWYFVAMDDR